LSEERKMKKNQLFFAIEVLESMAVQLLVKIIVDWPKIKTAIFKAQLVFIASRKFF